MANSLEIIKEAQDNDFNIKCWEAAEKVISAIKEASKKNISLNKNDWSELEAEWYDYFEELFND